MSTLKELNIAVGQVKVIKAEYKTLRRLYENLQYPHKKGIISIEHDGQAGKGPMTELRIHRLKEDNGKIKNIWTSKIRALKYGQYLDWSTSSFRKIYLIQKTVYNENYGRGYARFKTKTLANEDGRYGVRIWVENDAPKIMEFEA